MTINEISLLTFQGNRSTKANIYIGLCGPRNCFSVSWADIVLELVATYDNVYTDFSYDEFKDKDYGNLKQLIEIKSKELNYDLENKILFGSDFMICLARVDSYNDYLSTFVQTKHFTGQDKERFCSLNPQKFLY